MAEKEYIERGAALDAITYNPIEKSTEPDIIELTLLTAQRQIRKVPAADVVAVVRCRDCVHYQNGACNHFGYYTYAPDVDEDDFCSYGERKEQK